MEKKKKKGFTLIELLVVIAIIGILMAILFPLLARAKENARAATCLSNMKQLIVAFRMYIQDYDGYGPPSSQYNYAQPHWYILLNPYCNGKAGHPSGKQMPGYLNTCPTALLQANKKERDTNYQDAPSICGYVSFLGRGYQSANAGRGVYLLGIKNSSTAIVFADCYGYAGNYSKFDAYKNLSAAQERDMYRHKDGLNVCFFDGHATWLSRKEAQARDEYWTIQY